MMFHSAVDVAHDVTVFPGTAQGSWVSSNPRFWTAFIVRSAEHVTALMGQCMHSAVGTSDVFTKGYEELGAQATYEADS